MIIEENHKDDFLQQYRSNLQFCRSHTDFLNILTSTRIKLPVFISAVCGFALEFMTCKADGSFFTLLMGQEDKFDVLTARDRGGLERR